MASSNRSNRVEVPEAKAAMDRFKTEVASELGVNLKEGYNGDLTSKEAGSIGGEMVRKNDQETGRADEITFSATEIPASYKLAGIFVCPYRLSLIIFAGHLITCMHCHLYFFCCCAAGFIFFQFVNQILNSILSGNNSYENLIIIHNGNKILLHYPFH